MNAKHSQIAISFTASLIAVAHMVWPSLSIDVFTLAFFIIAIIPWLAPFIKYIEAGGTKIVLSGESLNEKTDVVDKVGLLAKEEKSGNPHQFSFQTVANEDPNLALAGLRIEIEKKLKDIAASKKINIHNKTLGQVLDSLFQRQVLNNEEKAVIADLSRLLNQAVHGAEVDDEALQWAMTIGPRILNALDEKTKK